MAAGALVVLVALSAVPPVVGGSVTAESGEITRLDAVDVVDADGDGRYSNFDVAVSADARMPNADPGTSDPQGEPRLKVLVNGEVLDDDIEIPNRADFTGVVHVGSEHLPEEGSGDVDVTVVLWDDDVGYGGEEADRSTISVPYEATEETTRRETSTTEEATARPTTTARTETTTATEPFSLVPSRSVTVAGAPVSFRTTADGTADLAVVDGPAGPDSSLVTRRTRGAPTFRATEPGTYTIRATADSGATATAEITVEPRSPLIRKYAPVLHYPAGTEYFPTRYEALVRHSNLLRDDGFADETVARDPTVFDLAGRSAEHYLELDGDEESYPEYDDEYPTTVYASVDENVAFDGRSYTAITYWLFYLYDPKAGGLSSLAAHQSDLETVTVLVDESGPQWVGASQHYGGERREWEKAPKDGTRVHVYPALGAHSNYLRDTTEYDGAGLLPQDQYTDETGGTTEVNDALSVAYADETGDAYTFRPGSAGAKRPDSGGTEGHDIVPLTGNEAWATYEGGFAGGPGEGPAPMQRTRWRNPGAWFESSILPDERQVDATIENVTVTPLSDAIAVSLEVENTGPKPNAFRAVVTANATDGDAEATVARTAVALGTESVAETTVSVPYPATDAERLDVDVALLGVDPSASEPEDVADRTTARVENRGGTTTPTPTATATAVTTDERPTVATSAAGTTRPTTRRQTAAPTTGSTAIPTASTSEATETPATARTTGRTCGPNTSVPGFGPLVGAVGVGLALARIVRRARK